MSTLFKLVAGEMLPDSGEVRVPARLMVIYVPKLPLLFDGSLGFNLRIESPQDAAEVWKLCEAMGMSREYIWNPDFDVGKSGDNLRHSDKVIVQIVRALHAGVDVLILSSVIDSLGPSKSVQVMQVLRSYVRSVGCSSHRTPFHLRHSKTIIYTSKIQSVWEEADHMIYPIDSRLPMDGHGHNPTYGSDSAVWTQQMDAVTHDSFQMQRELQHAHEEISRLCAEVEHARMCRDQAEQKLDRLQQHTRSVEAELMKQMQVWQHERGEWRRIEDQLRRQNAVMAGPSPSSRMRDYFVPSRPQRISPMALETFGRDPAWNFAVTPQYNGRGGFEQQWT